MVTENQGITTLQWPNDATVGDVLRLPDNNIPYELMPNLRWRNVLIEDFGSPDTPFGSDPEWSTVDTVDEFFFDTGEVNPFDDYIKVYPSEVIGHNDYLGTYSINGITNATIERYMEFQMSCPGAITAYYITNADDPSTPEYNDMPKWGVGLWEWWTWGKNLASFNRPHTMKTTIPIVDFVQDVSRMDEVRIKIDWTRSNGAFVSSPTSNWKLQTFNFEQVSKNYTLEGANPGKISEFTGDDAYPSNTPPQPPDYLTTGWIDMSLASRYIFFQYTHGPGQRNGGFTLTIDDPSAQIPSATATTSGLAVTPNGEHLYFVRGGYPTTFQVDMSTPNDFSTATLVHEESLYNDIVLFPGLDPVVAGNVAITEDGREFFIADSGDNKIKQFKLKDNYNLDTMDYYDPFFAWEYTDYYHEFQIPTANVLDLFVNRYKNKLYVLTDDNMLTMYDFTGVDVSTAVFNSEIDLTGTEAAGSKCFTMSYSEQSILLGVAGGLVQMTMPTDGVLGSNKFLIGNFTLAGIIEPRGLAISKDNSVIYVADNKGAANQPQLSVTQWTRS